MPRPIAASAEAIRLWTQLNMDAEVDLASLKVRPLTVSDRADRLRRLEQLGSPFAGP
jgi:hypothetical protein